MKITVVSLFIEFFNSPLSVSILSKAQKLGLVSFDFINPRDFTYDKHRSVDDYPYGGGCGMVMKAEPIYKALEFVKKKCNDESIEQPLKIYLTPQGKLLKQKIVNDLLNKKHILIFCGHYEDIDYRARKLFDLELSIGDYVLSGGEPAALVLIDAIVRKIPNVLGNSESHLNDSFSTSENILDYPHYTRPAVWNGEKVPEVLLSGNHKKIREFRRAMALINTLKVRPDLLKVEDLSEEDFNIIKNYLKYYYN